MKKKLSFILAFMLTLTLAGCGDKKDSSSSDKSSAKESTTVAETVEETVEETSETPDDDDVLGFSYFDMLEPGESEYAEDMGDGAVDGKYLFYDEYLGLTFNYPEDWSVLCCKGSVEDDIPFDTIQLEPDGAEDFACVVFDFTEAYIDYTDGGGEDGNELLDML